MDKRTLVVAGEPVRVTCNGRRYYSKAHQEAVVAKCLVPGAALVAVALAIKKGPLPPALAGAPERGRELLAPEHAAQLGQQWRARITERRFCPALRRSVGRASRGYSRD